ncbi:sodium:proton antiporter [Sphingomonas sinipercae]|uniref:Sodium:proton antiporter n=1 Tax=Sphingomonas sinipercae TaxID=2714944 RepID=A0A6G7ZLW3_9SPHN|nr:sodium:proton antiporter [Sphingomonas sinipercae]QIL01987.1 sodium:proton antiporter [Sphingomonas sinipercae]
MHETAFMMALVGVLGIGAQWLAWRTQLPAIALMLAAGFLVGPVFGLIDPHRDLGTLLEPLIGIAVAVILFEGGLNLKLEELHRSDGAVQRLVVLGVPIGWVFGSIACYYIAGLVLPVAILFAGILVVTGPTVVLPLLRQTQVSPRPRAILKWEAIVNDPIGALCAVVAYEWLRQSQTGGTYFNNLLVLITASAFACVLGYAAARAIAFAFPRGWIPEFLKSPVLLVAVIATFVGAEFVYQETGLLTVTVMGMSLANMRLSSARDFMRFKENVTVLLVSGLFIILSASLDLETLARFEWRFVGFVLALVLIVRPATVLISLIGTKMPWRERLFVGLVAPRGIVAVAISGLFALRLDDIGYSDGGTLVALSFAVVAGTILVYGFGARPAARLLGVAQGQRQGLLVVGSPPWMLTLASALKQYDVPVLVADSSWQRLSAARAIGVETYHGEILAEATEDYLDIAQFQALISATDNEAYNALVCSEFAPEIGRDSVYQIGDSEDGDPRRLPPDLRGRALFSSGVGVEELNRRYAQGWRLRVVEPDEPGGTVDLEHAAAAGDPLLIMGKGGRLRFFTHASRPKPAADEAVVIHAPPQAGVGVAEEPTTGAVP